MTGGKVRVEAAEAQAADWHQRLAGGSVSEETLERFFAWRADPSNAEAYRRVEAVWSGSGGLGGDPDILAAVNAAVDRGRAREAGRASVFGRPGLALAMGLGAVALVVWGGSSWMQSRSVFETGVGEQRMVALADGSSVRLDTASRVRVRYSGETRGIELEAGRAFFEVVADADRPFVVRAGDTAVTAIGTAFDVRRDGAAVRVVLVSGVVDVRAREGAGVVERLAAGEMARVTGGEVASAGVDAVAETGWTEGRIVFRDRPLAEAVAEVNRYLARPVVLEAQGLAGTPVNGVFRTGDRDAFVVAVGEAFGLRSRVRDDGVVVLSSP
jgi:transmembrane sensor